MVGTMLDRVIKDSEIERAWLIHEPARAEIPAEQWRKLRAFKRDIAVTAGVIEGILKNEKLAQSLVEPIVRKRGIGRQRKLTELRRLLPAANVKIAYKSILEISWLSPTAPIIANPQHQGEQQDCTLICYFLAWPRTAHSIAAHSAWAAEIPDHAAARLLQRSPRPPDLRAVLFEAGLAFLAAAADAVVPHVGTDSSVYLPAGDGAFAASIVGAKTTNGQKHFIYARAGTWLSAAMLKPDQIPLPRAATPEQTVALGLWLPESHAPLSDPAKSGGRSKGRGGASSTSLACRGPAFGKAM
jgi:hypothetical protein